MNGPLATHGGCTSPVFARTQPQTYMAVLQMLVTHCTVHHHFLASSSLLTSSQHSGKFAANFVSHKRYIFLFLRKLDFSFQTWEHWTKKLLVCFYSTFQLDKGISFLNKIVSCCFDSWSSFKFNEMPLIFSYPIEKKDFHFSCKFISDQITLFDYFFKVKNI